MSKYNTVRIKDIVKAFINDIEYITVNNSFISDKHVVGKKINVGGGWSINVGVKRIGVNDNDTETYEIGIMFNYNKPVLYSNMSINNQQLRSESIDTIDELYSYLSKMKQDGGRLSDKYKIKPYLTSVWFELTLSNMQSELLKPEVRLLKHNLTEIMEIFMSFLKHKSKMTYITESKTVRGSRKFNESKRPIIIAENKDHLKKLIEQEIELQGWNANLNHIDVSNIEDMSWLFYKSKFNGDISEWDVSNVKNISSMFNSSKFNGDISEWDVSNVKNMSSMFIKSNFNGDISEWDVSNVKSMSWLFYGSKFNGDISEWDVSNVEDMIQMFYKSKFNGDISEWDVSNVEHMEKMFEYSPLDGNEPEWYHRFYNESVGGKKMIRGSRSLTKRRRFNESKRGVNFDKSTIVVCYSNWQDKLRNKRFYNDLIELVFELADSRPDITETNSVLEIEFEGLIDASNSQISQLIRLAKKSSTHGYIESDEIAIGEDW